MKHAIILAHPNARSFAGAVTDTYTRACHALGNQVLVRDLYHIGFDPCLKPTELPFAEGFSLKSDVLAERALLKNCDAFALVYLLWLNAPLAIPKDYLERVFGSPSLLTPLALPIATASGLHLVPAALAYRAAGKAGNSGLTLQNPFELPLILRFTGLMVIIMLLSKLFSTGRAGLFALGGASGLLDVDPITLSMAKLAGAGVTPLSRGRQS